MSTLARPAPRRGACRWGGFAAALLLGCASSAVASDGTIEINHARVLAGGVTSGDTPGYPVFLWTPGSYRLTSDLVVSDSSSHGIVVAAPDVRIDLNGFAVRGPVDCNEVTCSNGSAQGVSAGSQSRTTLRNGTVTGFAGTCIVVGSDSLVDDLLVAGCGSAGVQAGDRSIVRDSRISGTALYGLWFGNGDDALYEGNVIGRTGLGFGSNDASVVGGTPAGPNFCEDFLCSPHPERRRFYATRTLSNGTQASLQCALGFHMASLYELLDVGSLAYESQLGYVPLNYDAGSGPPRGQYAWVRTGGAESITATAGTGNCSGYGSNSNLASGTVVRLELSWGDFDASNDISPWKSTPLGCNNTARTWCIEN